VCTVAAAVAVAATTATQHPAKVEVPNIKLFAAHPGSLPDRTKA
jgi:hypothetical protein